MNSPRWLTRCLILLLTLASRSLVLAANSNAPDSFPVTIQVNASHTEGKLNPIWRFFGADEPNYATMKDGRKLLHELGPLDANQVFFRAHNLLNTGDGTPAFKWGSTDIYTEDSDGRPIYNWTIVDHIFNTYLENGVKPYVEIGFMPEALSTHPHPYQHEWRPGFPYNEIFTGWSYPPKNYHKWAELVYQWVKHCVEKYGRSEVEQWYWETWNEANTGYWRGTPQEFYKLHDYAVDAVRRALPTTRVGGPDAAGGGGRWLRNFLEHCLHGTNYATGKIGTPLNFIAFHAKGSPTFVDGHVRMGIAHQLQDMRRGFSIVASFPELKHTPIIIGESDPEGCAACQGPQLAYRNGMMYASYTAAVFARKPELAAQYGVNLEGALTWAFEFENQPYFAGFRQLASCGIDLPVLNVFRMFSKMGGQKVAVNSSGTIPLETMIQKGVRGKPDVSAVASIEPKRLTILVWHYHDDDVPGPEANVDLAITGLPVKNGDVHLTHYRVDDEHSNAYAEWKRMGSPLAPTRDEYNHLLTAGELAALNGGPADVAVDDGTMTLKFLLPRQAVSLLVLEWK